MVVLESNEYLFNVCDVTRIACFESILFALILTSSKLCNSRTKQDIEMVNGSLPKFLCFRKKNKTFRFIGTLKANTCKYGIRTENAVRITANGRPNEGM